eukprot:7375893-Karenia_brevis.AAC.1
MDPGQWDAFCRKHGIKRTSESDGSQHERSSQRMKIEDGAKSGKRESSDSDSSSRENKMKRLNMLDKQMLRDLKQLFSVDVAEVFSPKRVTEFARDYGLSPGWSLDLTTYDENGKPWDFTDANMRNKAVRRLIEDKPLLLIGSPPCTYFSQLMNINWSRMNAEEARR